MSTNNNSDAIGVKLFQAAKTLAEKNYPVGWGGAAAMLTQSGKVLTSVAPEVALEGIGLCMETGSICEAHKLQEPITHTLCISRRDEQSQFKILSPCGVCQERLVHWGYDLQAAITNDDNEVVFKSLKELMPHHWAAAFEE